MFLYLKKLDWVLIISVMLLVGIGLLSLYSSSMGKGDFANFKKQAIFASIGIFLMFLFSSSNYRIFKNDSYLILVFYFICLAGLAGLFFIAPEIRGVKSWYKLGPISLDPSELTKIALLLFLAKYFSSRHIELYKVYHIMFSGLYLALPAFLIAIQPNMGSALILVFLWLAILIISGIRLRLFLTLCLCGFLIIALGWSFLLQDYQKARVIGFIFPGSDPLGISWNQTQSKIAVGSGGILGQGFGNGSQTQYGFLPEPQTDFIFSAIAEEFGLVGVIILFFLMITALFRIIKIAINSQSNFPRLFASGFAVLLITQVFINIGMNLGLLPVIGIPLPLVSYGGGSLVISFIGLGIIQSIKRG